MYNYVHVCALSIVYFADQNIPLLTKIANCFGHHQWTVVLVTKTCDLYMCKSYTCNVHVQYKLYTLHVHCTCVYTCNIGYH